MDWHLSNQIRESLKSCASQSTPIFNNWALSLTATMHESPSSMSAQPTPSFSLDDQDEDVRIAVRALGAMRNSAGMSQSQSSAKTCARA